MGSPYLVAAVCLGFAYLLGGIPFALVVGKLAFHTDVREHGSGNLGATNVYRTLGAPAGAVVLALDAAKGVAAVLLARLLVATTGAPLQLSWFLLLVTLAAIAGHTYSPYLRLEGGKGMATAAGGLLAAMPLVIGVLLVLFLTIGLLSRMVSLASVLSALTFPFLVWTLYSSDATSVALSVLASALVIWRHRTNISRIIRGEEPRLGRLKGDGS